MLKRLLIPGISNPNICQDVNMLVCPHNEILLRETIERHEAIAWINLKMIILSKKIQAKKEYI